MGADTLDQIHQAKIRFAREGLIRAHKEFVNAQRLLKDAEQDVENLARNGSSPRFDMEFFESEYGKPWASTAARAAGVKKRNQK